MSWNVSKRNIPYEWAVAYVTKLSWWRATLERLNYNATLEGSFWCPHVYCSCSNYGYRSSKHAPYTKAWHMSFQNKTACLLLMLQKGRNCIYRTIVTGHMPHACYQTTIAFRWKDSYYKTARLSEMIHNINDDNLNHANFMCSYQATLSIRRFGTPDMHARQSDIW